jgi:transposase
VLGAFFTELGEEKCAHIEVCVLDMWDPYIASIHEHTHAAIVYDLFHVIKEINDAVDTVRKQEFEKVNAATRKKFKKKRFLILKRGKRLDDELREMLS